eukprot:jgi/Hompol1/470/HPOL_005319-RA
MKLSYPNLVQVTADTVFDLHLAPQPLDIQFSRILDGHAAILQTRGGVLAWDSRFEGCTTWRDSEATAKHPDYDAASLEPLILDHRLEWMGCRFGAHPRTLNVARASFVEQCDFRQGELITGIDQNPLSSFDLALATNRRTMVLDARFTKEPMLSWGLNNSRETQLHIEYLPDLSYSDSHDSLRSSTFMTWGRHVGEVMFYSYDQEKHNPPTSSSTRKMPSFATHPHVLYPSLNAKPFMDPFMDQSDHATLERIDRFVSWPPLTGCQLVYDASQQDRQALTLLHLTADGAVYSQVFGTRDCDEHIDYEVAKQELDAVDSVSLDIEIKRFATSVPEQGDLKSHQYLNVSGFAKLSNRWIAETIEQDEQISNDVENEEISGVVPTTIQASTIVNGKPRFSFDQEARRIVLPRLFSSRKTVTRRIRRHLRSIDSNRRLRIIKLSKNLSPWAVATEDRNNHEFESATNRHGNGENIDDQQISQSIDSFKRQVRAYLNSPQLSELHNSNQLALDTEHSLEWLARDLAASQYAVLPCKTRFEIDRTKFSSQAIDSESSQQSTATDSDQVFDGDDHNVASRRDPETGNLIDKLSAVIHTPLVGEAIQVPGSVWTLYDVWQHPEHYYRPDAQLDQILYGTARLREARRIKQESDQNTSSGNRRAFRQSLGRTWVAAEQSASQAASQASAMMTTLLEQSASQSAPRIFIHAHHSSSQEVFGFSQESRVSLPTRQSAAHMNLPSSRVSGAGINIGASSSASKAGKKRKKGF